ncbi:MAG: phosphotransferase enzyme family protein [Bacilli bacterium]
MNILEVINLFDIPSPALTYRPYGNGHINATFFVTTENGNKYVLQKINHNVFKDTNLLMNNIFLTTEYLRSLGFESLRVIRTKEGELFLKNSSSYYRLYDYIENTICHEKVDNMALVYSAAKAFGKLHRALSNFDASELGEIIPDFHNTHKRYLNLLDAIKLDKFDRVKTCFPEIEIVKAFEGEFKKITDGIERGEIAHAVTHNDPKINNILFDQFSGDIKAVIDLDTIMPGSYLFDFGDALRSLFTGANEDSEDLSKLVVDFEIFETYTRGYLSEMEDVLTPKEIELLPFSAFLLAIECGIRFLEDYIRGDVYFKTQYPIHNLVRARTQITLAKNIYKELGVLSKIVEKARKKVV